MQALWVRLHGRGTGRQQAILFYWSLLSWPLKKQMRRGQIERETPQKNRSADSYRKESELP